MDLRRIRELADAFEAGDWDEIDLEIDGVRIQLSAVHTAAAPRSTVDESPTRTAPLDEGSSRRGKVGPAGASDGAGGADDADGTPVVAPSPGIFWRAPSPGEPPFVNVGDRVEPDTVVGIVELMKLMNRVAAGVSGTVTAVLADNGQPVEKGGALVLVDQD